MTGSDEDARLRGNRPTLRVSGPESGRRVYLLLDVSRNTGCNTSGRSDFPMPRVTHFSCVCQGFAHQWVTRALSIAAARARADFANTCRCFELSSDLNCADWTFGLGSEFPLARTRSRLACQDGTQRRMLYRLSRAACSRQAFNALRRPPPVLLRLSGAALLVAAASHQFWSMTAQAPAAGPVPKAASDAVDSRPVDYASFYGEYHGHTTADLSRVLSALHTRKRGRKPVIYLAGDSSLDNKYWFDRTAREPACNGYEHAVTPPFSRPDVAWAINRRAADVHAPFVCVNGAIEEATISDRCARHR